MSGTDPEYSIVFTGEAFGDVKALDGSVKIKLEKALAKKLAVDPKGYGLPLRSPLQYYWKHEFAAHRINYRIYDEKQLVVVCAVGSRKQGDAADVYKQFQALAETGKVAQQIAEVLGSLAPGKKKSEV